MRRIVKLIPISRINWSGVKRRMSNLGIDLFAGKIAEGFFTAMLTRKRGDAYVVQPHHLWTTMMNGTCIADLFDTDNPPASWVESIRRVNRLGISVADSLRRGYPLLEDGRILSEAIKRCRPDLWSVVENTDGYSEKYFGWNARVMLDKLIRFAEAVESGQAG